MKGWVALCSRSQPGLILSDGPVVVTYPDKTLALAWTGIHLGPNLLGQPWSSRTPKLLYPAFDPNRLAERP